MLPKLIAFECLCASFFLVFAIELDFTYHIFQNGVDVNVQRMISMTVRTLLVLALPCVNTRRAK